MIKHAAYASNAIQTLLKEEGLEGVDVAEALHISPQLVSNIKNGHRKLQRDIAKDSIQKYDSPLYLLELLYEFTGGLSSPVMRGKSVEQHRLAFEEFTIKQLEEAKHILDEVSLVKPPGSTTEEEQEQIKEVIYELLDAEMAISNLIAVLCKEYDISYKRCVNDRKLNWKARGWI